ncbi:MAG TPA: ATP-binding protein, partial [Terriglobales bacterium]|nr:ATP-binding protein [Terriglobales bacterium]
DARRAISIISQVRALAQRDSSEQVPLSLNEVIRDVIAFLHQPLERSRISITVDLQEDMPLVQGHPVQLQQAFANVLLNSIEAMESSPDRDRRIIITSGAISESILIEIRDSGPGFDPQVTERLFEPRYTTKPEGLGLGLPLSRSIMDLHGGSLTSRPLSKGAGFEFRFPLRAGRH